MMYYFVKEDQDGVVTDTVQSENLFYPAEIDEVGQWVQVEHLPAIGHIRIGDVFACPQPHASWTWDSTKWVSPVPMPTDGSYTWDEATTSWVAVE